jgi:hypothetical protein
MKRRRAILEPGPVGVLLAVGLLVLTTRLPASAAAGPFSAHVATARGLPTLNAAATETPRAPAAAPTIPSIKPPSSSDPIRIPSGFTMIQGPDCSKYGMPRVPVSLVYPNTFVQSSCAQDASTYLAFQRLDATNQTVIEDFGISLFPVDPPAEDTYQHVARYGLDRVLQDEQAQGFDVQVVSRDPLPAGQRMTLRVDAILRGGDTKLVL